MCEIGCVRMCENEDPVCERVCVSNILSLQLFLLVVPFLFFQFCLMYLAIFHSVVVLPLAVFYSVVV